MTISRSGSSGDEGIFATVLFVGMLDFYSASSTKSPIGHMINGAKYDGKRERVWVLLVVLHGVFESSIMNGPLNHSSYYACYLGYLLRFR